MYMIDAPNDAVCQVCLRSGPDAHLKKFHDSKSDESGVHVTLCSDCIQDLIALMQENLQNNDSKLNDDIHSNIRDTKSVSHSRLLKHTPLPAEMSRMLLASVPVGHIYKWGIIYYYKKTDRQVDRIIPEEEPNCISLHNMHNAIMSSAAVVNYIGPPEYWLQDDVITKLNEKLASE